jgi:Cysteine-rich secretory protein family
VNGTSAKRGAQPKAGLSARPTVRPRPRILIALLLASLAAPGVRADPIAVVNGLRGDECRADPVAADPVRPNQALDDVARELSRGASLEEALDHADYPAKSSSSLHVRGARSDAEIRQVLVKRSCESIGDPRYAEIGVSANGSETWIVLGVRAPTRPPLIPDLVARRVLDLVNAARAEGRQCGDDRYEPAEPVTLSRTLSDAALGHVRDMAERGSASHTGSDGSDSGERITRAGYTWHASGENVAAGQADADAVVAAWLGSPGHCATLMAPYFTETGIAFALAPGKDPGIYWTQVFAAP